MEEKLNPELKKELEETREEAKAGKVYTLSEVKKELKIS